MTTRTGPQYAGNGADAAPVSVVDALLVYAEPLASGAHVAIIGDARSAVVERLFELGARTVHVFDPDPARAAVAARTAPRGVTVRPLVDELGVREGAFDLAIVPDLAELSDPRGVVTRLRRAVDMRGVVVAMGRTRLTQGGGPEAGSVPFATELGPASLDYAELYDLFAVQFEEVSLVGVVPFRGVVFAQLGGEDAETPAVSVDTRLAPADGPSIFVVVAGQRGEHGERLALDPYAIVRVPERKEEPHEAALDLESAFAETRLKVDLLAAQLEEARDRVATAEARSAELTGRLERAAVERDGALTRAMELEAVLAASRQTMTAIERRLLEAERGILERDDRVAVLSAELEARCSEGPLVGVAVTDVIDVGPLVERAERAETALAVALAELNARNGSVEIAAQLEASLGQMRERAERAEASLASAFEEVTARREAQAGTARLQADLAQMSERAERAEAALALHVADLAHVSEAHAKETESYEEQLRDRARVIASLEKELVRREQLVKELVATLEESREQGTNGTTFESAPPLSVPPPPVKSELAAVDECARLRSQLDELAAEVARREGELIARAWRITELDHQLKSQRQQVTDRGAGPDGGPQAELARARDEIDALRQALTKEHAARVAAESGEELARARSELARQVVLLEQMRERIKSS